MTVDIVMLAVLLCGSSRDVGGGTAVPKAVNHR